LLVKSIRFLGDSLKRLREFPDDARQDAGYQLDKVQRGEQPTTSSRCVDWPWRREIRVWDEAGTFQVIYTAASATRLSCFMRFRRRRRREQRDIDWCERGGQLKKEQ